MNKLYIDTETTGLNQDTNGIIALDYIIENTEGEIVANGTFEINTLTPDYTTSYSPKALEINGYTVEQIQTFQHPKEALIQFDKILTYNSNGEKYQIVAYNAQFDKGFLEVLYNKYLPGRFWNVITHKVIDTLQLVIIMQDLGIIDTGKSQGLKAVAKHFNIEHNQHECKSDNNAQMQIYKLLSGAIDYSRAMIGQYIDITLGDK